MIKTSLFNLILFFIISLEFLFLNEFGSFLIWITFYIIGNKLSYLLIDKNNISKKNYFPLIYSFFSLIGLIIFIDNQSNFNSYYGYAHDDFKFFSDSAFLLGYSYASTNEISIFSYFGSFIMYPFSIFKRLNIIDFTIINWVLAGLISVVLNNISNILLKKNIPALILVLSYPLFFIFSDTFTRYYRDAFITFFLVLAVQNILQNKFLKSLVLFTPILLLRRAFIIYYVIFYFINKFQINNLKKIIVVSFLMILISSIVLPNIVRFAMMYGSDSSRVERYKQAFSNLSNDEIIALRFKDYSSQKNKLMSNAYSSTGFKSIITRWAFSYFYPLTFYSPYSSMLHYDSKNDINGFYLYRIFNWFNTVSIIFCFPLFLIGIFKTDVKNLLLLLSVSVFYLIIALLISGQPRHTIPSYIFLSVFYTSGYYFIKKNYNAKIFYYISSLSLFLLVLAYNILR